MKTKPRVTTLSASSLSSTKVTNPEGENLGKVEDLMISLSPGTVEYAVLSFGGVLGMGDKLFAIPWPAIQVDTDNERFILDVKKETLKAAPGFDKDNWPDFADPSWRSSVNSYYGVEVAS